MGCLFKLHKISLLPFLFCVGFCLCTLQTFSQNFEKRKIIDFNFDWKFALGHACDVHQDFNFGTNHFSYLAKTGYGDGAASEKFDDRAWRTVQLPHDWCVTLPFDARGSNSHGSKAIGKYFPEHNIGWYRKSFFIPLSDTSKRIRVEFEGVYRNSRVFVNGFYLGTEQSGYTSFDYDITEYLNFGGNNVISVRVDAGFEEGWFYEGAGIYRNVRLVKTSPLHVAQYGTFVTTNHTDALAEVSIRTTVQNDYNSDAECLIEHTIYNSKGEKVQSVSQKTGTIRARDNAEFFVNTIVDNPVEWSLENPYLYVLHTRILSNNTVLDDYRTEFGIRNLRFSADSGFFLNGKQVKVKGVCVHQDHAGVGVAIPYELQKWRIQQLQDFGVHAIRTAHNPPSPDLLQICDELGMLVMNELRLMGINEYHTYHMRELIMRDRNHPSVFIWSLGNEEWQIEGSEKGARIIERMQHYAHQLDSSRYFTVAISGGWDTGIGTKVQVMGYNYLRHGDIDKHHALFPWQPSIGTEESNTVRTRGIYETRDDKCWLAPKNLYDDGMEGAWKFFYERDFLAGLFYWTGFDYRGEPTPYGWPAVVSQFGIFDLCGFPKDNAYYLKSWWPRNPEPVVHVESHWNRTPGDTIDLLVYSNCKEVELIRNNVSLGRKSMPFNGHITWPVYVDPGTLIAYAYGDRTDASVSMDIQLCEQVLHTSGKPSKIVLNAHKTNVAANGQDMAIVTVSVVDKQGNPVPDAHIPIHFSIDGPGKIIGVGNGNPLSHEQDIFQDSFAIIEMSGLQELPVAHLKNRPEVAHGYDYSSWRDAFSAESDDWQEYTDTLLIIRGTFVIDSLPGDAQVNFFSKSILKNQSLYINGHLIRANIPTDDPNLSFVLDHSIVKTGENEYCVIGQKLRRKNPWEMPNRDPGLIRIIYPHEGWKRNVFNGLAQVLVQSTHETGIIKLTATAKHLKSENCIIQSIK
ncbi:MAG: DUF4982 domain-containing protein [Bacteroidales bacterium]|jgi:beta-galactosidase|nr:DUF4982 domain-containing protein [Bacteroidales bacterium]